MRRHETNRKKRAAIARAAARPTLIEPLEPRRHFSASLPAAVCTSLAYDKTGNLVAAYVDGSNGELMFTRQSAGNWSTPAAVDPVGPAVAGEVSIAVGPAGQVDIAYYSNAQHLLKFASLTGTAWQTSTVDTKGTSVILPNLGFQKNGTPLIAYYNPVRGQLNTATQVKKGWGIAGTKAAAVPPSLMVNPVNGALSVAFEDKQNRVHVGAIGKAGPGATKVLNKAGPVLTGLSLGFGPKAAPEVLTTNPTTGQIALLSLGLKNKLVSQSVASAAGSSASVFVNSASGAVSVLYTNAAGGTLLMSQATGTTGTFSAFTLDYTASAGQITAIASPNGSVTVAFSQNGATGLSVFRTDKTPLPPVGLSAAPAGLGAIALAWTESSADTTGFLILRSTDGKNFTAVTEVAASARTYSDAGLSTGTYYYRVQAVGSDGSASASVAVSATVIPPAAVSGFIYVDANDDGSLESNEPGIAGLAVVLTGTDDAGNSVSRQTTTATDGSYSFTDLRPGAYSVSETAPAGYTPNENAAGAVTGITLAAGQSVVENFGQVPVFVSFGGTVFVDTTDDGTLQPGESGIAGATVTLAGTDIHGVTVHKTIATGSDGTYAFTQISPGNYTLSIAQPTGYLPGLGTGSTSITAAAMPLANNFAEVAPATIGGFVYDDKNDNGIFDSGDTKLSGVTVHLAGTTDLGAPVALTATTGTNGSYQWAGLRPGTYTVSESTPAGMLQGIDDTSGSISDVAIGSGGQLSDDNFAAIAPAQLAGTVFKDQDNNGFFDSADFGIAGVVVTLSGLNDLGSSVTASATTNSSGNYSFPLLRPGQYQLQIGTVAGDNPGIAIAGAGGVAAVRSLTGIALAPGGGSGGGNDFPETVPTQVSLLPSNWLPIAGQSNSIVVTVASTTGQMPTGTVTLYDGASVIGSGALNSSGKTTISSTALFAGTNTLTAGYGGDGTFTAGGSGPFALVAAASGTPGIGTFTAVAVSASTVTLSWNTGGSHSGYEIYRSLGGSGFAVVAAVAGSVSTFSDSDLLQGVSYSYRVVATDDGNTTGTASATTLLPAPAYQGPPVEPSYPAGFDTFSAPVSTLVAADSSAPSVDNYTQTADPGETIAVTAESLTNSSVSGANGTGAGFLAYGQTTGSNGVLASAGIETLAGQAASVTVPSSLPSDSVYFVWPTNTDSSGVAHYGSPVEVNAPQVWWADQSEAIPGGIVSLFGRNLTQTPDGNNASDTSWVYLQNDNGLAGVWIKATNGTSSSPEVNPYKLDFSLPSNLYGGSYTVWVNNGLAGHYSWSNSQQLTVGFSPWTPRQVAVTEMTEAGLESAIATATSEVVAGNGTAHVVDVNIPAGTISITQTLEVPGEVQLIGAGAGAGGTLLQVPAGQGLNEAVDLGIQGQNGIQNLAVNADDGGISMTSLAGDGRQPAVVQVGSVSQVISGVSLSDVNSNARGVPDVNASTPVTGLRVTDSTFTGPGLNFVGATDLLITGCTFIGAGAGNAAVSIFNGTDVAFTDSTIENLSNDPSLEYSSAARVYWQATLGDNIYVGGNTSVGLFPEASLASGLNGGEQILSESNETQFEGSPVAASNMTVASGTSVAANSSVGTITLPASAVIPGQSWTITIGAGPGLGETAIVASNSINADGTDTVTLDRPWAVIPTAASVVSVGTTADRFVVYNNDLTGDGNQSFNGSTDGVQLGGTDIVIAANSVTGTGAGISLHSDEKYAGENATVCDFDQISGNTVSNVHFGLVSEGSSTVAEPGDLQIGNVWEGNTVTDVHNTPLGGDLPSAIWVSTYFPYANGQFADNIFENNEINAPIAMTVSPGGNLGPAGIGATVDALVLDNTFVSDGTANSTGVLATVTENGWATLVGNSYSGFAQNNAFEPSTSIAQLIVPQRAITVAVAPGQTAGSSLLVDSAGGTAISWQLVSTALPAWLAIPATSGTTGSESAVTTISLSIDATGLSAGIYSTKIQILLGGADSVDVLVTLDVL